MNPSESSGWRPFLRSPQAMMLLVVACAAMLWVKLDAISKNLTHHVHGTGEAGSGEPHTHTDGTTHSHPIESPAHQHGPFHASSHPPDGRLALVPEWAPCRWLALALPGTFAKDRAYLELLERLARACLEHSDVDLLLVVEQNDVAGRAAWDAVVRRAQLDRTRIRFYEAKALDSIWLRDYGPIFVRRRDDGQLFVVDAAYRDLRMLNEENAVSLMGLGPTLRPADDLAPIYFATLLNKPFVHPGFALNGGDLYADGRGTLYTSEETVHLNTGDREYLDTAFRQFFGVNETRYLQSLPGPTVKHIDMFFKLVSPTTCLLGQYRQPGEEGEVASLQRAAGDTLDQNAAKLLQLGMRVIRVPMPDIAQLTRWEYLGRVFSNEEREERVREFAASAELPEESIRAKLRQRPVYVYRTYLNSILLAGGRSGRQAEQRVLLIPDYPAVVPAEIRQQAEAAYHEAYGEGVRLVPIDAESLAHANGSLRCIACSVPAE